MDLREVALRREYQNAARFRTERKRFLSVGRGHLGDDEMPGADEPVLEAFRLRRRLAGKHGERDRSDRDAIHVILPGSVCAGVIMRRRSARGKLANQ
jgi:hypothetical protein